MEKKEGTLRGGGGIYRESKGVPRGLSCGEFVGDVLFRSLVGFMKEYVYGHGCPCVVQSLTERNKEHLGIISSVRKLQASSIPSHGFFFFIQIRIRWGDKPSWLPDESLDHCYIRPIFSIGFYGPNIAQTIDRRRGRQCSHEQYDRRFSTTFYESDTELRIMYSFSQMDTNNGHQGVRSDRFRAVGNWFVEYGRVVSAWQIRACFAPRTGEWEDKFRGKGEIL